jgi:hypothetical protein
MERRLAALTPEEADGVVNVALHPALFHAFVGWLDSRDLDLSPAIDDDNGGTFRIVSPRLHNHAEANPDQEERKW